MSFYDQASLQDILAQGQYGGMGLGQAVSSIPQSGYSNMAATDPGFVGRVTQRMQQLIEPSLDPRSQQNPDQAYGRASSFERGNQGVPDDETSAMDVATAIIKTPFALLNAGRNALQDTLGFGGADWRQRQRDEVQALQNLPQAQRQILGIDRVSGIQTPSMAAGETSGTAGAPSSLGSNAGSTMKGYVEWANSLGKDRAEQTMNQVRATIKAQYMAGKITQQELQNLNEALNGYRTAADTNRIEAVTNQTNEETRWIAPRNRAQIGALNASAYDSTMGGDLKAGQLQTVNELRPGQVDEQNAKAKGEWTKNYWASEKGNDEHLLSAQSLDQNAKRFPYSIAGDVAKANADIALANQRAGVYGASGSGNTGENSATANLAKTDLEQRKALAETILGNGPSGRPAMDKEEAYDLFGVPKTVDKGWLWDSTTYDTRAWDPTAGARDALKGADTRAAATAIPLLPMPGIEPAPSSPVRATGDDINRVYNILQASPHGGYSQSDKLQHAETLASLAKQLGEADEESFATAAYKANVPIDLIELYWKSTHGKQ